MNVVVPFVFPFWIIASLPNNHVTELNQSEGPGEVPGTFPHGGSKVYIFSV